MLRWLKIGPRLALAMGLTLSVFIFTLGVLWVALGSHIIKSERVRIETVPLMVTAEHMALDVSEVQQFLTDVSATRDRHAYADAEVNARDFITGVEIFKGHYRNLHDVAKVRELEGLAQRFQRYYTLGKNMAEAYLNQGTEAGNRIMRTFDQESTDMQTVLRRFEEQNLRLTRESTDDVVTSGRLMQDLILICGLAGLSVSVVVSFLTVRSITLPVAQAVKIADAVAAGDLTFPIGLRGDDELDSLLNSMTRMQANLRQLLANANLDAEKKIDATTNAWKSTLQGLRRSADELEDLYQNAPCGYHSIDAQGRFVRINDTELGWLGYERDEVLHKPIANFLPPACRENFSKNFYRLVTVGETHSIELEFLRKDGSVLPILISESAVVDEKGEFVVSRSTVFDLSGHRNLEDERAEKARHIEALSRRLITVQEKERRDISSELHDRTGANLATFNTYLKLIATRFPQPLSKEVAEYFDESRAVLKDTIRSVREICADLRPTLLDYAGLLPALDNYARQFEKRNAVRVRLDINEPEMRWPHEVESNLFRIVQEALTNCAKHAQAEDVCIELEVDEGITRLSITDNGIGFDPDGIGLNDKEAGLGLITMRERSEFIGGRFTLETAPGKGTQILVEV